jgi:prevent-host-death family protein
VRELNQNTAGVLARVKLGEHIDITERGAVIARLLPAEENPMAALINAGKLRLATVIGTAPRPSGPIRTDHEAGQLLRELRDTERY